MNLLKLSWKNISARPLNATLNILLLALGVAIISLMLQVGKQLEDTLNRNIKQIDMVMGAKGSPLQLILSAVFQIDAPTGNISLAEANRIAKSPLVKNAIPLAYGDSYRGFRIVGTEKGYADLYQAELGEGKFFEQSFQVVLGANAARELRLNIGDKFQSQHGLDAEGEDHEAHFFEVVGILKPSGTVADQLLLTSVSSVWEAHHHEEDEHSEEEETQEITAMLIQFRSPMGMVQLPRYVNEKTNMQSALPSYEVYRLLDLMGIGISLLQSLALGIMVVSGLSLFISLYNALKERKYEMALLRNFGASRLALVQLVLQEGILLTTIGFALGILLSRLGFWAFTQLTAESYHYQLGFQPFMAEEAYLLVGAILIGILASILPAIQVFRLQISKVLGEN